MRRLLALAAALVALPACDSGADAIGVTGEWEGTVTTDAAGYDVELRLRDDGRAVSGSGTVGSADGPQRFTVSGGSFVNGDVSLPLFFASDPIPGTLTGSLTNRDPGRIEGTFSGPSDLAGQVRIELVAR